MGRVAWVTRTSYRNIQTTSVSADTWGLGALRVVRGREMGGCNGMGGRSCRRVYYNNIVNWHWHWRLLTFIGTIVLWNIIEHHYYYTLYVTLEHYSHWKLLYIITRWTLHYIINQTLIKLYLQWTFIHFEACFSFPNTGGEPGQKA